MRVVVVDDEPRMVELITGYLTENDVEVTGAHDGSRSSPHRRQRLGAEMRVVVALDKTRTDAGIAAATWLEAHDKKDIWKLYAHDQKEVLDPSTGKDRKAEEKAALKMAEKMADDLGARFGSSAPYVRMPALRKDHTVTPGQKCPCSYPSRHAAAGAASRTVLGTLMPDRAAQYRATEAQIDYSRIYMAGHFSGDIRAGALLGDVIGDYFLITRNRATTPPSSALGSLALPLGRAA